MCLSIEWLVANLVCAARVKVYDKVINSKRVIGRPWGANIANDSITSNCPVTSQILTWNLKRRCLYNVHETDDKHHLHCPTERIGGNNSAGMSIDLPSMLAFSVEYHWYVHTIRFQFTNIRG